MKKLTKKEKSKYYEEIKELKKMGYDVDDLTICKQCECIIPIDFLGKSELAIQDNICQECMEDGYGR